MSKHTPFVHLHLHTSYSLLDGACRIGSDTDPQLIAAAKKLGMPSLAITDHGVMYGAIEFYKEAKKQGIKPLLGCEVYEAPGSRLDRKTDGPKMPAYHLVLLAADNTGYANLTKLVTAAHLEGFYYKPRIDRELLARHSKGLIALSACLKGRVPDALLNGDEAGARRLAGEYAEIFGKDNFYIELQDHGLPDQQKTNPLLVALAQRLHLPLVATNDAHYLEKAHAEAHDVLLCIQTGAVMSAPDRMRYGSPEFYLKSGEEMAALFRELPEALANTFVIADRCDVALDFKTSHFPAFQVPEGHTAQSYLEQLCRAGIRTRYGVEQPDQPRNDRERTVVERMRYELGVIEKTGFTGYFLIVWDFIRFARERHIPVGPGRGSGAGSLVSYALGITGVDPLHYKLVFERFLNPERVSPPDFDIDFCVFRRGEVIEYVKERYGRDNVAQIITFGALGAKTVIRDIGRALEIPLAEVNKLAKLVPDDPKIKLDDALQQNPEFKKACEVEPGARIIKPARVLEGLLRHAGVHAAGVVIGDRPLVELIPLARDKNGEIITQYSKYYVETVGLLKADFLGLRNLTVIDETVKLVKQLHGVELDIAALPMDDPKTFALLRRGDTIGVFQLESRGMRELVKRIGMDTIDDLNACIALYRPGTISLLDDYVHRKSGIVKIEYDDPRLEPILGETYGIMLYQEQVQQVTAVLAGYSLGQGDLLRRAMSKKNTEEMEKQRQPFVEGCRKTSGLSEAKAEKIFNTIAKFAGYGFNKSHSTGYAVVAYQTAYLKANYPIAYMAALISSEIGDTDTLPKFMTEARAMEIEILPPDVNASAVRFMPEGNAIRYGLAGIKNVGEGAAEALVAERTQHGPYRGLIDFCTRLDSRLINRKVLETLARCGALDGCGAHRAQLCGALDLAVARAEASQRDRRMGQASLFALLEAPGGQPREETLPPCPRWHESELLAAEKELLGIYMSGHPLAQYARLLQRYRLATVAELADLEEGAVTRIGGLIAKVEKKFTKNKDAMAVLQVEDMDGTLEAVVFPSVFAEYGALLQDNKAVMLCGEVSANADESMKLIVREVYPLEQAPRLFAERLGLRLAAANVKNGLLQQVRDRLKAAPGAATVSLCLQFPGGEEVFLNTDSSFRVAPDEALVHDLERLLGEESVYVTALAQPCRKSNGDRRGGNGWRRRSAE